MRGNDVMTKSSTNLLYYGDNLDVMRLHIKDETVDLVYLDPPFNSNTNYNVCSQKKREPSCKSDSGFLRYLDMESGKRSVFAEIVMAGAEWLIACKHSGLSLGNAICWPIL